MKKRAIILCLIFVFLLFLVMTSQAAEKRVLRVSTWGGLYQESYEYSVDVSGFEKEYNVEIEWVLGDISLWLSMARLGEIDVVTCDLFGSINGLNEGLWLPLDETKIPNMANLYPKAKYNEYTVWSNLGDSVIAYNSNKIPIPPTSWEDMWDDAYYQKVALPSFNIVGTLTLVLLLAEKYGGGMDNIQPGLDKFVELYKKGNLLTMVPGDAEVETLLQLGEVWITKMSAGRVLHLQESGVDWIKIARPKEGTTGLISTVQVVKSSPNPDLAMKFINHVLSPECQEIFAKRNYYAPTVNNAKIPPEYEAFLISEEGIANLYTPDLVELDKRKEKWIEMWERATQ